tara:strand:+ start:59 stop:847 length:789 start_codon:yes stop_codon:yes gene_type:complete
MKIAVLGGNRFTGKLLVETLVDKHDVTLFNRSQTGNKKTQIFKFDRDSDKINFQEFDCIVDMCLYTKKQFTKIKKIIPKDTRYIFMSTGATEYKKYYGDYAKQKQMIENALSKTDLKYTIVRPSYIDGVNNHLQRIRYLVEAVKKGYDIRIEGDGTNSVNIVWVDDVVKVLNKIINAGDDVDGKTYDVCANKSIVVNDLIEIVKKELSIKEHKVSEQLMGCIFPSIDFEMSNKITSKELKIKFSSAPFIVKLIIEDMEDENT